MRKKLVSFICTAVMMAAIPMQAHAAELTNVNGVSIETADYSDSYFWKMDPQKELQKV